MPDYSDEVRPIASPVMRAILVTVGTISVGVGLVGIVVPLLPTTPFLLLAAACYARASTTFYNWLLNHRWFGPTLHAWRKHRAIPRRSKRTALFVVVVTFSASAVIVPVLAARIVLAVCGVALLAFLWRVPALDP